MTSIVLPTNCWYNRWYIFALDNKKDSDTDNGEKEGKPLPCRMPKCRTAWTCAERREGRQGVRWRRTERSGRKVLASILSFCREAEIPCSRYIPMFLSKWPGRRGTGPGTSVFGNRPGRTEQGGEGRGREGRAGVNLPGRGNGIRQAEVGG